MTLSEAKSSLKQFYLRVVNIMNLYSISSPVQNFYRDGVLVCLHISVCHSVLLRTVVVVLAKLLVPAK